MKPRFFTAGLRLQLALVLRRLPALLCMVLAVLLLSALGATAAAGYLASGRFANLTLAVVVLDEDDRLDTMVQMLGNTPEIKSFATLVQAEQPQAYQMVESGEAAAALVLPEGFFHSLLTGENLAPTLVVDSAKPVETALLVKLARSTVRILASVQQGIGYTMAVYDLQQPGAPPRYEAEYGINYKYFTWVLGTGGLYRSLTVNTSGVLSVPQHYLLSALLYFVMLAIPVLYRVLSLAAQRGWVRRLRAAGCPTGPYVLGQLLLAGAVFALLLGLLALGAVCFAGGQPIQWAGFVPGLLLCAIFMACYAWLCCNLGGVTAASVFNFLLATGFLVTSGGLIPQVLLPAPLAALVPFSPLGWMHSALSPLFGAPAGSWCLPALAVASGLLLALCLLKGHLAERRPTV